MLAYKAFQKGTRCRGYKFKKGWNITDNANCARNGFHCCENPLDCFGYYAADEDINEFWLIEAAGDIHEDGSDTRIACTHMRLIRPLTLFEFIVEGIKYIREHPYRDTDNKVNISEELDFRDDCKKYLIVRGKNPIVKGLIGHIVAIIKEDEDKRDIKEAAVFEIDGKHFKGGTWYRLNGYSIEEVCDE